jgi:hypothetical protein
MIKSKNLEGTQAVTANRLRDGAVVFLTPGHTWSRHINDSAIARSGEEGAALLAVGNQAAVERIVVEPYLIEISAEGGAIRPLSTRETIRAFGPSVEEQRPLETVS